MAKKSSGCVSIEETELRELFNSGNFVKDVKAGKLKEVVVRQHHPSPPLSFEPFCTKSQMVEYHDLNGKKVAIVHQYLRTDGTIGASGKPDPKLVLVNGVRYNVLAKNN